MFYLVVLQHNFIYDMDSFNKSIGEEFVFLICTKDPMCEGVIDFIKSMVKLAFILDDIIDANNKKYKNTCFNIMEGLIAARRHKEIICNHEIARVACCIYACTKNCEDKVVDFGIQFEQLLQQFDVTNSFKYMNDDYVSSDPVNDEDFHNLENLLMTDDD